MFGRHYTPDVRPEGTTASSKGFSQREQAEEGQYIKKKELEKLKASQKELEELKKKHVSVDYPCNVCIPSGVSSSQAV
jgi:hypothetical protein